MKKQNNKPVGDKMTPSESSYSKKPNKKFGIQINLDTNTNECAIGSTSGDAWTDIAVCLEGLSVICKKCIENGMSPEKVYGEVFTYFNKAHQDYKIKHDFN